MSDGKQVATTGGRRLTAAEEQNRRNAAELKSLVNDRIGRIEASMPTHIEPWLKEAGISPGVFMASVRLAMAKNPEVARCTPMSLMLACMDSARIALPPDGKKAAIVPFKKEATFVPMRDGIVEIMGRAGYNVSAQVVYEGEEDLLDYDLGSDPFVTFKPPLDRDDARKVVAAFAIVTAKSGNGKWVELMGAKELAKVARVSKTDKVRKEWPGEMHRKAPLRRVAKFLPSSPDLDMLNSIEAKAYLAAPPIEVNPKRLSDDELLDDTAGRGPVIEHGENLKEDDEAANLSLIHRYTEMINSADDAELLAERHQFIIEGMDYEALPAEEKALYDMALRMKREEFGLDPETGAAPEQEKTKAVGPFYMVEHKSGRRLEFETAAEWQAAMLDTLAKGDDQSLNFWWEANQDDLQAAARMSRKHAARVLMVAAGKGLAGPEGVE